MESHDTTFYEYVTHRNHNLNTSISLQDFDKDDTNTSLCDTSMMSLMSLSNTQTDTPTIEQIKKLTQDLLAAKEEIENLNKENYRLKLDLEKHLCTIETLKTSGQTPTQKDSKTPQISKKKKTKKNSSPSTSSSKKDTLESPLQQKEQKEIEHKNDDNETTMFNNLEDKTNNTDEINHKENNNSERVKDLNTEKIEYKDNTNGSNITLQSRRSKNCTRLERNKIIILADQQGRNLQHTLQILIGDRYQVQCISKPGAKLNQILQNPDEELLSLTFKDYLIILGGTNDNNLFDITLNLQNWFLQMTETNVIVCEVPYNKYLREQKLNYEIKFLCTKFLQVSFVALDYSRYRPRGITFTRFISRTLHKEILRLEYKHKIINYNLTKNNDLMIDKSTQTDDIGDLIKFDDNIITDDINNINNDNTNGTSSDMNNYSIDILLSDDHNNITPNKTDPSNKLKSPFFREPHS